MFILLQGLLGSYYAMVEKLFGISGGIFLSYAYLLAQKPQGSVEGIWMAIFIGIFIASLSNFILLIHASYLKERGSIDGYEPGILKWLMLLVLAFLYALFCILLRRGDARYSLPGAQAPGYENVLPLHSFKITIYFKRIIYAI